jgi:hypothetical protein
MLQFAKNFVIISLILSSCLYSYGQQPQTQTDPLYAVNAKYVQGVGIGYWPTPGSGLTLKISSGTVNCGGSITTYAGGTLSMTANTTNYVYLATASSCVPSVKITSFTSSDIIIATVVTGSSTISSVVDARSMFSGGNVKTSFSFGIGQPSGPALSTGWLGFYSVPLGCTISGWSILVDAGTATVKVAKVATGTAIPTTGNYISTNGESISSGTAIQSTTVTDFTTTIINNNDIIGAYLTAVSGASFINFQLQCK